MEGNGSHVTWREFNLVLSGIEDIKDDLKDLRTDVVNLRESRAESLGERAYRRWLPAAVAALVAGLWWIPNILH